MRGEPFKDRVEAGRVLGELLVTELAADCPAAGSHGNDYLVLGLARGGMPVAAGVAQRLGAALGVLVVRKLGLPGQPELAMGAVADIAATGATDPEIVRNTDVIERAGISPEAFDAVCRRETTALREAQRRYTDSDEATAAWLQHEARGRVVIVVDDGFATGASMRVALTALRRRHPAVLIAAFPVGPPDAAVLLTGLADRVVCAWTPAHFGSVGQAYEDFTATSDERVRAALRAAAATNRGERRT